MQFTAVLSVIFLCLFCISCTKLSSSDIPQSIIAEQESTADENTETEIPDDNKYEIMRTDMVQNQIAARDIRDEKVIDAMLKVPRHNFVDKSQQNSAYDDRPLPIGMGQTISQPYIVALMTESLELTGSEKVLEIGTGSGYQAAVLAEIVNKVYTVEIIPELYNVANERLKIYDNVEVSNHDGYYGWEEYAPFDRIIVTAAPDHIPQPLVFQLKDGGIMVIPVGPPGWSQTLYKVIKDGSDVRIIEITGVIFVPLTRTGQ